MSIARRETTAWIILQFWYFGFENFFYILTRAISHSQMPGKGRCFSVIRNYCPMKSSSNVVFRPALQISQVNLFRYRLTRDYWLNQLLSFRFFSCSYRFHFQVILTCFLETLVFDFPWMTTSLCSISSRDSQPSVIACPLISVLSRNVLR